MPFGVVTASGPVVAPNGTVARSEVAVTLRKLAGVPLNVTEVVPVKPVPVIVTDRPTRALNGEKPVTVGALVLATTVNTEALLAVPPGVVTWTSPVVAEAGTVAVIWVAELTV